MEFIDDYFYLLQIRHDGKLQMHVDLNEENNKAMIPPCALQVLIENAIKHNIVSRYKPLYIDVHVNGNNTLVVKNNLQLKKVSEPSTQIGLQNIRKRYQLICDKDIEVVSTDKDFTVSLPLLNLN